MSRPSSIIAALAAYAVLGTSVPASAQAPAPAATPPKAEPKAVEEGIIPKSIKIPGTDVSLGIGGYVKVDFIQDFGPMGDAYEFKTNSIAVGDTNQSGRTTIHARETRLNLDLRSGGTGRHHFRAFVEGDFFGDGNSFRLRHGYGEFGPILAGQTWSTFQDISARPLTVDFEGPDGEVFLRQAMLRFTGRVNEHWTAAIAVENPTPQFALASGLAGSAKATMPDIPGFVRYQRGAGHVQVAGLVRQIRFDSTGSTPDESTAGWGVNATFVAPLGKRDQLLGMFAVGKGTARYIEALSGQNLDARQASSGSLDALQSQAGTLGLVHHWRADLKSGLAFSTAAVDDDEGLASSVLERVTDVRVNLFWTPYKLVDFAGELLYGERRNQDGATGDTWRLQFAAIYRLN